MHEDLTAHGVHWLHSSGQDHCYQALVAITHGAFELTSLEAAMASAMIELAQ